MSKHSKKITIIDIAKHAGVSKSTVSLVINQSDKLKPKTIEKVQKSIQALGYVYHRNAANLRSRDSNLIAILANDMANPYLAEVLVPLQAYLEKQGYFSIIVNLNESCERQEKLVKELKERNVTGFVICPAPETDVHWFNTEFAHMPCVQLMRKLEHAQAPAVLADNLKGGYLACRALIEEGHSHFAYLGGNPAISDYHQRLNGVNQALSEQNLSLHYLYDQGTTQQDGYDGMNDILHRYPHITAVCCFTDTVAYGALSALTHVPQTQANKIAIIGFDDLQSSPLISPSLSSISIPAHKLAYHTCEALMLEIDHKNNATDTYIDAKLILRQSTRSHLKATNQTSEV